jgi:hypothetical protein
LTFRINVFSASSLSHLFLIFLVCVCEIIKQSGVLVHEGVHVTNREHEIRSLDCRLSHLSLPQFVFGPMGSGKSVLLQRLSQEQEFCIYANMRSVSHASQAELKDGRSSSPQDQFSQSLTQLGVQLGLPRRSFFGTNCKIYCLFQSFALFKKQSGPLVNYGLLIFVIIIF